MLDFRSLSQLRKFFNSEYFPNLYNYLIQHSTYSDVNTEEGLPSFPGLPASSFFFSLVSKTWGWEGQHGNEAGKAAMFLGICPNLASCPDPALSRGKKGLVTFGRFLGVH